ncbi:hypothetical protein A2291_07770 [candidate division WOR-1 bacterium RIFOXYB2_FULL_42_35]|uniref:NGG1p interacting factor NIF3 n=1 Tax=candidate division WOR-1 bacterium RIFOXYC2_FULL_41_25 TaxID=1802586 RepID=A0A1F4TJD4_UNCSA|nr:MAG: hypothetical protein A2247_08295 [candidate division WOR-1 bacterium RIFOXYA2_FULL_41_14]OGC21819.1 MAG: hypothetical protein A2291_07770 [candidate division WOR-1 bacterium RIFOXYB2_FULL_42_35]OGC32717.1 MAG: hypothetical protein A2462_04160 [candidate division WOR-1 bacterium RIFOXYC2_FULL_41_25]OGC44031.1 MAG: hypothetical protein A2548_00310 [candidate division WOR-1 bacterium RIFOXYD2_FULL_41_8]
MTKQRNYKLVVFVPQSHLELVRIALCKAGAGQIGKKYDNCTFMSPGIGTFQPLKGVKPFLGRQGKIERVGEARLETIVPANKIKKIIAAMKKVHPYEEAAYDVYKLENY